jgi:hypothetical protein
VLVRRTAAVGIGIALLIGGSACSSGDDDASSTTTVVPSFSCLAARTALGLSKGSRADQAEQRLEDVIASDAYTAAEHAYFRAVLRRLRRLELAKDARIEDRLDDVACDLRDGDPAG